MSLESRLTAAVVIKTLILQSVIIASYYIGVLNGFLVTTKTSISKDTAFLPIVGSSYPSSPRSGFATHFWVAALESVVFKSVPIIVRARFVLQQQPTNLYIL